MLRIHKHRRCLFFQLIRVDSYFAVPTHGHSLSVRSIATAGVLAIIGYLLVYALQLAIKAVGWIKKRLNLHAWYQHAIAAGLGLSALFLIGGEYVQFTGNEFIQPLLATAGNYTIFGLLTVGVIKLLAMAWSHELGYRGGLVFPFVLVLTIAIALVQRYVHDVAYVYALTATLIGAVIANKKNHTLF